MAEAEKVTPEKLNSVTDRLIYKITEGIQRLNSIGSVQYIQINLSAIPDSVKTELSKAFTSAIYDGMYINQTIVLEQMDSGDSFMRIVNAIRKLYRVAKTAPIEEVQAVVNIEYKGESMDVIITYDPEIHDISLVSVSQHEEFFKILEYVRFFWSKSRPRI